MDAEKHPITTKTDEHGWWAWYNEAPLARGTAAEVSPKEAASAVAHAAG
jgi:hypothetical protein